MEKRELTCSCCGDSAGKWEQWHNQDSGYGICRTCVDWIAGRTMFGRPDPLSEPIEFCWTYGLPGTHYEPRYYRHYGFDFAIVAEFSDTEQGMVKANRFMEQHPDNGVLAVEGGRIIVAGMEGRGVSADKQAQDHQN